MDRTFVTLIPPSWDFNKPHAGTCIIGGYMRGFEQIGIPAVAIVDTEAEHDLPRERNPFILLGYDTFNRLSDAGRRAVSACPHFIWVNVWSEGIERVAEEHNHPDPRLPAQQYRYILDSGASFLFCNSPESYFCYYANWIRNGQKLVSLFEACDTERYYLGPDSAKFTDVKMALVNGYFSRKAFRYEQYLWPHEHRLKIWGYNEWPKCYQGYLPVEDERVLYQNAIVCPAIGEAFAERIGAFYERPFKILGSGGLVVPGVLPGYREVFDDSELLVPETVDEFHDMIMLALHDEEFNQEYREAGHWAVVSKHTYAHRARQILELLNG